MSAIDFTDLDMLEPVMKDMGRLEYLNNSSSSSKPNKEYEISDTVKKLQEILKLQTADGEVIPDISSIINKPAITKPKPLPAKTETEILDGWHGWKRNVDYKPPKCVSSCDAANRPGYRSVKSHEYIDQDDVLDQKLDMVLKMFKHSKNTAIYSGAGLSTATGMYDYASKSNDKSVIHKLGARNSVAGKKNSSNRLSLKPTMGHHALVAIGEKQKYIHHWVQQNHDRLAQKAGYPQNKLNEIHGAWGDHKNPVVAMSGSLRQDLCKWLEEWEDKVEVCVCVGSSLCGMRADSIAQDCADRSIEIRDGELESENQHGGLIVIGLQATPKDEECAVRIWGLLDDVLLKLAEKCGCGTIPNPKLKLKGEEWANKHPNCLYQTPIRK